MADLKTHLLEVEKNKFKELIPQLEKERNIQVLLAFVRGSHMYGTSNDKSDVDITFVCKQPTQEILKGNYLEQLNVGGNDIVGYEIQRYIQLLGQNNPNIIESLDIPEDCLIYRDPSMEVFRNQADWLSKAVEKTILGYADSQIKKATGLNKHMNRKDVGKKDLIDFCYIIQGDKSQPLREWAKEKESDLGIESIEKSSGLVKIPNGKGLYGLYLDPYGDQDFRGILKDSESTQLRLSSIPKDYLELPYTMYYNQDGYEVWKKEYTSYQTWIEERNQERFRMNQEAGQNVDLKNMMHLFRLLEMALNISLGRGIQVRSENVEFLREIREGQHEYKYLMEEAQKLFQEIKGNFESVDLPERVSKEKVKDLLLKFRLS